MADPSIPALVAGSGGLPKLVLVAPDGARAEMYLHGAHVTSWEPADRNAGTGDERLFLSSTSEFRAGVAIRGGVPVIFPQFAGLGPLPKHGFARTTTWELLHAEQRATGAMAALRLVDSAATRAAWPHAFEAVLTVTVGGRSLSLALAVRNTGAAAFTFTGALHTYLRVADVRETLLRGLRGTPFGDSAATAAERPEPALRITGEVDRVYLGPPPELTVEEPGRTTLVATTGFPDVVVWNPGPERGATLPDLEPDGYRRMLCVEAAVVGTPVRLAAGERWTGTQTLTAG